MSTLKIAGLSHADRRPLVVHVVFNFAVGGLENGVVSIINRMPAHRYRHAIVSLTEVAAEFVRRIDRDDVAVYALCKPAGHAWRLYPKMLQLFAKLEPAVVHTRNLAALEAQVPAWLARVPGRVHGEHGWDVGDIDGSNWKFRVFRRAFRPLVHRYVALSKHLATYLTTRVGVPAGRIVQIYNGVDLERFHPSRSGRTPIAGCPFVDARLRVVGTVGRMQRVKDQVTLARAFVEVVARSPSMRDCARLVLVGDGPLRVEAEAVLDAAGLMSHAWFPGERRDVPEMLRGMDCFVLPSLAEGISNTILEAMATGLPVVATDVGGNGELVEPGLTGQLVPAGDVAAMAGQIAHYLADPKAAAAAGSAGRARVERAFGVDAMVDHYMSLYDELTRASGRELLTNSRKATT